MKLAAKQWRRHRPSLEGCLVLLAGLLLGSVLTGVFWKCRIRVADKFAPQGVQRAPDILLAGTDVDAPVERPVQETPSQREVSPSITKFPAADNRLEWFLQSDTFLKHAMKLRWIKERIISMSAEWKEVHEYLQLKQPGLLTTRKRILVFPGLLTERSSYDFAANAFKGGYLGELVQWSDLLAALVVLGHGVDIETAAKRLPCLSDFLKDNWYDLVYTDYIGLSALRENGLLPYVKCRVRVLDSFGTEPSAVFATLFTAPSVAGYLYGYDLQSFKQFMTLYPHSPDNSFLGHVGRLQESYEKVERLNQAVIYGKEARYFEHKSEFLEAVSKHFSLHITVAKKFPAQRYAYVNHGLLPSANLSRLLHQSKLFVGLGFPYEGPAPMEALAAGCVVLQARFDKPLSSLNTDFFRGKPTRRGLHTQHPYLSDFIGEPHVYSINIGNLSAVNKVLKEVAERGPDEFKPVMREEFTAKGFAHRIGAYIKNQNFCPTTENIALDKSATSSAVLPPHTAGEAVSRDMSVLKCVWLKPGNPQWWMVDLAKQSTVHTVVVDMAPDLATRKDRWKSHLGPVVVHLLNSLKRSVAKHTFVTQDRISHTWVTGEPPLHAHFVKVEAINTTANQYFVLCNVAVYSSPPYVPTWPDPGLLQVVVGKFGESCVDACHRKQMVCEPAFFPRINQKSVLESHFSCTGFTHMEVTNSSLASEVSSVSLFPAYSVRSGMCHGNGERLLLTCSGAASFIKRLCPCRRYQYQQVALPPEDSL